MTDFITIAMCKELLAVQQTSYAKMIEVLTGDLRNEIRFMKNDINDLKASAQFQSNTIDSYNVKIDCIEKELKLIKDQLGDSDMDMINLVEKVEYLENSSRRNNIRIVGVPEAPHFRESWEESEQIVKDKINTLLGISEDLQIERAHRVGKPKTFFTRPDGSRVKAWPRPIVAKFQSWKQKESVLKEARAKKPDGIKFFPDLSQRTLEKRERLVPQLLDARKHGKIAYFVLDKLVVKEKGPTGGFGPGFGSPSHGRQEASSPPYEQAASSPLSGEGADDSEITINLLQ
eukprot:Seg1220.2 transcript_id=Seg1220.2/GoldUCD/mRNA.D3Y31 product="LINE-1 type transposase domain-containing protein 1" protein_id=Seg1220.2/GoldUCD/D3Y31